MPLLGVREVYAVGSIFSNFSSSFVVKVCVSVVPEILIIADFAMVGVRTRHIPRATKKVYASDSRGDWHGVEL